MKPGCQLTECWGSGTLPDKRVNRDNGLNFNCNLNFSHHFVCRDGFKGVIIAGCQQRLIWAQKEIFMAPKLGRKTPGCCL